MSEAGALSLLFECAPGSLFEVDHLLAEFGGAIAPLQRSGLLIEAAPARYATCFDCGDAHLVSVERNAQGRLSRLCVDGGGWADVDPASLRRCQFDHTALLAALAKALGISAPLEPIVDRVCWRLGTAAVSGADYALFVAREMNDANRLMAVGRELKRFKNWRGVVMCSAPPLVELGLFPSGLSTRTFDDLIAMSGEGELMVDRLDLEEVLNLRPRGRGAHGAAWDHPHLGPLIDQRFRTGVRLPSATAEARWLLANADWARRGKKRPTQSTLCKLIARRWQKLS
jgi:hypothetical protein